MGRKPTRRNRSRRRAGAAERVATAARYSIEIPVRAQPNARRHEFAPLQPLRQEKALTDRPIHQ